MTTRTDAVVVLVTAPSAQVAARIARAVVKERRAACCNVVPKIRSYFTWKGKMETAEEALIVIKTRRNRIGELAETIRALHPYSVPEIIVLPIAAGGADYLAWINEIVGKHG